MATKRQKQPKEKPLTLKDLVDYNQSILFPALEEKLATKDELNDFKNEMYSFKDEMYSFKDEMYSFKDEMQKFKNESLTNQDKILKKLDILLDEKAVADYQYEKQKKLLSIHHNALKKQQILSPSEIKASEELEVF